MLTLQINLALEIKFEIILSINLLILRIKTFQLVVFIKSNFKKITFFDKDSFLGVAWQLVVKMS